MTKHRTDRTDRTGRETAAGKAQINYRDPVINLYAAYHAISLYDESSQKFYRTKNYWWPTDDLLEKTTKYRTEKLLQEKPNVTTATL